MEIETKKVNEADATWGDVGKECCSHTGPEWGNIALHFTVIFFFLYFFLFSLGLLGTSAKIIGGCTAGNLMGDIDNPIAGLCIGILATVLMQSSSTTTSITVGLVPDVIGVELAIFVIMGANIGTSVTNTIVSMGHLGNGDELERAFAGATVHDMFNFLAVIILLPVEAVTGYLFHLTKAMTPDEVSEGEKWVGPVKKLVSPLTNKVLIASKMIKKVASGDETCEEKYPTSCYTEDDYGNKTFGVDVNYDNCNTGLIGCDKKTGECPLFFQEGATQSQEETTGFVCMILSVIFLCICLHGLVKTLSSLLSGASAKVITKATDVHGLLAMAMGAAVTVLVQSSSITTSVLTPLVGMDVIPLHQMFPLTLGANLGTTVTALLASLVSDSPKSLQVALAHLFFNITGILILYPIPKIRALPLEASRWLGRCTRKTRYFPLFYIFTTFVCLPLVLLAISSLFESEGIGYNLLGWMVTICLLAFLGRLFYFLHYQGGREVFYSKLNRRALLVDTYNSMPEELENLKKQVAKLNKNAGFAETDIVPRSGSGVVPLGDNQI